MGQGKSGTWLGVSNFRKTDVLRVCPEIFLKNWAVRDRGLIPVTRLILVPGCKPIPAMLAEVRLIPSLWGAVLSGPAV